MFCSCKFKLNTIYHHTGVTAWIADGKSAWIQVSQLLCSLHYTTWQFLTTQLCRCENLCLKYPTDSGGRPPQFHQSCIQVLVPEFGYETGSLLTHVAEVQVQMCTACILLLAVHNVNSALLGFC